MTTEQKSCYFRNNEPGDTEEPPSETSHVPPENKLFFATKEDINSAVNPFKKTQRSDVKENIPIATTNSSVKFESVLTRPSHVVSSHSSAINLEKTVSQKLFDEPKDYVKSDSQESLGKIPSPIKSNSRTLGLVRKPSQSSISDNKPSQISSNKWISTQSKNRVGSGSKKHPIKIGLTSSSQSKKQRTLNCFAKKSDADTSVKDVGGATKSKYFQID